MAFHVAQELAIDPPTIGAVPMTGAIPPVEQLQVAVPEVVAAARVGEVERSAGIADQWSRAEIGPPIEPAVGADGSDEPAHRRGIQHLIDEGLIAESGVNRAGGGRRCDARLTRAGPTGT